MTQMAGAAALPVLAAFDSKADPLRYDLKPVRLDDGVWMIAGAQEAITMRNGGAIANVAILDTSDGPVIIDTGPSRRFGEQLLHLARELTGKEPARIYLTHVHPDHIFGSQAFAAEAVAAPAGVIDGLKKMGEDFATAMYHAAGDWMRGTELRLPARAMVDGVETFGRRRLRCFTLAGHSSSDLVVFDETSGLLFTGDLVFLDRAPTTPLADLKVWSSSLGQLEQIDHALLVPGHGPAEAGHRGIAQTREWLDTIGSIIRSAFERGFDVAEAIAEPLPKWTESIALSRYEYERSVMHLYPKLEAEFLPATGGKL